MLNNIAFYGGFIFSILLFSAVFSFIFSGMVMLNYFITMLFGLLVAVVLFSGGFFLERWWAS